MDNDAILTWYSFINAVPESAPEDPWLLMVAKPRATVTPTPSHGPAKVLLPVDEGNVKAQSSTFWQPEHWTVACKGKSGAKRLSPPPPPRDLLLANKFDILDMQEFPPLVDLPLCPLPSTGLISQRWLSPPTACCGKLHTSSFEWDSTMPDNLCDKQGFNSTPKHSRISDYTKLLS